MVPLAATAHTSNDQHGAGHGGDLTAACSLPTSSPSADRLTIGTISGTLRNGYRRVICAREAPSMSGTLLREGATQHRAHTVEEDEEE
ncbi:MAG: hypothetical protein R3313_01920 [Candidatus Saccharimonadales bacterium]|nr:hypothetical protein [Candidatus Saccharimonadales bacterium]